MTNELDIIQTESSILASDNLIKIADEAEKRIQAVRKIKAIALQITNPNDWVDENGKPYLQSSGGEKVGRLFGISWRISDGQREELEGGHFKYTYKGEFSLGGATIEAVGTRSSKQAFFNVRYKDGEKVELPASEIDSGNVMKAAYSNCVGNGVTRILGIRNLTWDEVEEYAKFKRSETTSVKYKEKKQTFEDLPVCPTCGKDSIIKGKEEYGGGYVCYKKKGGCGAKFKSLEEITPNSPEAEPPEPTSEAPGENTDNSPPTPDAITQFKAISAILQEKLGKTTTQTIKLLKDTTGEGQPAKLTKEQLEAFEAKVNQLLGE